MKSPLVGLCLAFAAGIITAAYLKAPLLILSLLACLFLLFSIIFIKKVSWFSACIFAVFFLLGAASLKNSQILPNCHLAKNIPPSSAAVSLKGIVASDPLSKGNKTSFIFIAEEFILRESRQQVCGKVLVNTANQHNFGYGQTLILTGTLYRPYNFSLSSRLSYRDYLRRRNIHALMSVKKNDPVQDLGISRGNPVVRLAFWLKHKMEAVIERSLDPLTASILNAMLLGERKSVPRFVNDAMIKTGTVHILVVSGFNVGIVAFIILTFLKVLRMGKRLRLWLTMVLLVIYCLLTGASTPVIRATVMGLVLLLGYLMGREPDLYNSLAIAAMIILAFNPWQILDAGFQLSFVSVLSIAWVYPKIRALFSPRLLKVKYLSVVIQVFAVSFSAWLGTAGLIAYYFNIISPVTVLANMVIVPLTSFITACGFALVILGKILPPLSYLFARSCELAILGLLKTNSLLIHLRGAYYYIRPLPLYAILVYYLVIWVFFSNLPILMRVLKLKLIPRID